MSPLNTKPMFYLGLMQEVMAGMASHSPIRYLNPGQNRNQARGRYVPFRPRKKSPVDLEARMMVACHRQENLSRPRSNKLTTNVVKLRKQLTNHP